MAEIFVSYARSTATQAHAIAEALRAQGYQVWRDDQLPAHRSYAEVIEERLKAAKAVVVVWSAEAARSEWVQSEADRARADRKLVQLTVDLSPLPMPFDRIQCVDLSGWTGDPAAVGWKTVTASIGELVRGAGAPAAAPPRSVAAERVGVCVLPFANMSGEAEQEYFSDGISEDIITDLSKVSALAVVSRNTAFTFKGKAVSVAEVSRQLGVTHVLEGSVRKAGNRVRITAQLIEGASDSHVWAERYDRDLDDIFALQDEISQAIVAALKLKLLPEEKQAIGRRGTSSAEAYNLYLMARRQYVTGNVGDARREEAIIRLCRRAAEVDPGYAAAWALMGWAQHSLINGRGRSGDNGLAALERALQLDPDLALPHATRARLLGDAGRLEEAQAEMATALRLGPDDLEINRVAGALSVRLRQFEAAIGYYDKASTLDESEFSSPCTSMNLRLALGDREGALRDARLTFERVERVVLGDPNNGFALVAGAGALAQMGEAARAREWMERAMLLDPDNLAARYNFACILAVQLADPEAALEMLRPLLAKVTIYLLSHLKADPDMDPLRGDPRFQAVVAEAEARLAGGSLQASG